MLSCQVTAFYALRNNTAAELNGVPANGTRMVAISPSYFHAYGLDWSLRTNIQTGDITVLDIRGNVIPVAYGALAYANARGAAETWLTELQTEMSEYSVDYGKAKRLHWNLSAQHALMDLIGEDVLCTDFTSLGVTKSATISKMEPVYALVMQGMYTEAAALTATLAVDDFFTSAKIAQYQAIIAGADAFAVVL